MRKIFTLLLFAIFSGSAGAQTVSFTLTQQPCNNNGILTATFTGLTAPITATWYVGNQPPVVHAGIMTSSDVLNSYSGAGVWLVATDANNLTAYNSFSGAPPFTIAVSTTPASCPIPGTATATITGGLAPYTYQWIDGSTQSTVSTVNPANLPAGGYDLIVTDANGCVFSSDSIGIYSSTQPNINISTTPANCTNGTAVVNSVAPGVPPYSYLWSNGATTAGISGLTMGSYNVTITDGNGCNLMGYVYINQAITIGANVTTTPATCIQTNGAVTAFGSGGLSPYTYSWSNGATTQTQTNIASGSYTVTVTDANGCIGNGYAYVNSTTPITVTQSAMPSSCTAPTGSATLTIAGGVAPYVVSWSTFPAQTGTAASNLSPGTYSFHITDANGCVRTGSVYVPPVNVINAVFSSTSPTCVAANGSITVNPSGGATPYSYSWSNSATTQTISGLAAGGYNVTITDNAGCSVTKSKMLYSSSPVSLGLSTTQASCIFTSDGSITANPTGGTAPYTYSWSNGGNTATISSLASGTYYVSVTDANGCTAHAQTFVPYNPAGTSCYCTITGTVYDDLNANCTKDAGEPGIQNIQIHCSGIGYAYTNASGVYSFKVPSGSYTLSENVLSFYPLASCQSNSIAVTAVAASGCVQTNDFANVINPIHDMHISTWDYNQPVPGNNYNMIAVISNQGTVAESGIIGGLNTDNQLSAPSLIPSSVFTNTSANWYQISSGSLSLSPGASQSVLMDYSVPTNIPISTGLVYKDSVAYTGPMSNWLNDYSPWNNVNYFTSTTVSSFDPNFKEVNPKGTGAAGVILPKDSVLEYMVHFQNTGTYQAQKVVVVDTLDADLDWSTLRPVYQSHPCVVTMNENGIVTFTFNNINLPAQMFNEMGSNGMLTYTIETKPNLPDGTQFTNKAAIYFDYNVPVITNTTLNTLNIPQGINEVNGGGGSFSIHPNPAAGMFYATLDNKDGAKTATLNVTDLSGKTILSRSVSLQQGVQHIPVAVETLTPGLYLVHIVSNGKTMTQKLVIMK